MESTPERDFNEHRLTIVPDELHAEMVRAVLEAGGVASIVRRPTGAQVEWGVVGIGMTGAREVLVDVADRERAQELLAQSGADVPVTEEDEALAQRGTLLRRSMGVFLILVFGAPIAYGIIASIMNASSSMS